MNYFFATDYTDFHRFFYSNPRKSVKFVAVVLAFPLKTVEPFFLYRTLYASKFLFEKLFNKSAF